MLLAGMGASGPPVVALTTGDELLRLKQDAMVVLIDDQIAFVRARRAVRITTSPTWEAVAQALIEGTRSDRVRLLAGEGSDASSTLESLVGALHNIGALEAPPRETRLSGAILERHRRTLRFFGTHESPGVDRFSYLERLLNAKVFVVGLGGVGSWIAYQLLMSGVGTVSGCDGDVVEMSNLNRTALISPDDVGNPKTEVLHRHFAERFPDAALNFSRRVVTSVEDLADMAAGHDLIIGAADQPYLSIRLWVSGASLKTGVPSLQTGGGRVGPLFVPGRTSCAGCLHAALLRSSGAAARGAQTDHFPMPQVGTLCPQPAADSAMVALEAVRFLTGCTAPVTLDAYLQKGAGLLDGVVHELPPQKDCVISCGGHKSPTRSGKEVK
ncbi:ThiF family adenylyltransferase [Streptomyces sp. NPDC006476]|uniref:ThiF family adenylyltransferase n=1 Tax=Streptomyces sp. NPDC006476 TaxID=3157175 RepID=UPI0033B4638F